jgi:TrmH family RNA methyltransferase
MANFNFNNLFLINPCELDDECYSRAMHASNILDKSKIFKTYNEAIKDLDYLVATSSIESKNDKRHLRNAIRLNKFSKKNYDLNSKIGLIFGREDFGLFNHEIALCDILLKIPTSENYLSLNLSHAVGIVLYCIYIESNNKEVKKNLIGKIEKEKLDKFFSILLDEINYPEYKKDNTEIMLKRLMGRAILTKWEYHTMMGIINRILYKIKR